MKRNNNEKSLLKTEHQETIFNRNYTSILSNYLEFVNRIISPCPLLYLAIIIEES